MINLKNLDKNVKCKCGIRHKTDTEVVWDDAFAVLPSLLKREYEAGGVLFLYEEASILDEFEPLLSRCGKEYSFFFECLGKKDEKDLKERLPEEYRFAVCVGGDKTSDEIKRLNMRYIFLPTKLGKTFFDDRAYKVDEGGVKVVFCKPPSVTVVDEKLLKKYKTRDNLAYGYSLLTGSRIYLAELLFSFGKGENVCPFLFDELKAACADDFSVTFFEEDFVCELAEKLFKISLLRKITDTFSSDTALLFYFLCDKVEPELKKASVLGGIIYLYYTFSKTLGCPTPFFIIAEQPDEAVFQLSEILGFDYGKHVVRSLSIPASDVAYSEYCLKGMASNMIEVLGTKQELSASLAYAKKIMQDGGYSLKNLCVNDLADVLVYACVSAEANTFLKYCFLQGLVRQKKVFKPVI